MRWCSQSPESPDTHASPRLTRNVRVLGLVSLMNDIASEMSYPLVPTFLVTVLGGTRATLGLIEGVAESFSSLLKLASGGWSDRVRSRKRLVVLGYAMAAIVRPLMGLLTAPWQLMAARVADRVGKGVRTSPRDALIADSTDPALHGWAFGFHRAMDHLGAALGPVFAAVFLAFWPDQLRGLFLLTVIPGLLVLVLLGWGLREPPRQQVHGPSASWKPTLSPFGRDFRVYLAALAIFALGNSSDMFLLMRATELGVPAYGLPLLWCVFHVAKSAGNLLGGRLVDRLGPPRLIFAAWLAYAAVYAAFAVARTPWQVWVLFVAYALYYALAEPAEKTLVARLVPPEHRGLAFGWYHLALGLTALPASALFGAVYEGAGAAWAFGLGAALAAAAALVLLAMRDG